MIRNACTCYTGICRTCTFYRKNHYIYIKIPALAIDKLEIQPLALDIFEIHALAIDTLKIHALDKDTLAIFAITKIH